MDVPRLPPNGLVVARAAERAGIGLKGIELQIEDDLGLLGTGLCGYSDPEGRVIILFPDAFSDMETLVKTLGHERVHAFQASLYGPIRDSLDGMRREAAARETEEMWWRSYRGEL